MWGVGDGDTPPIPTANMAVLDLEEEDNSMSSFGFWVTVFSSGVVIMLSTYYSFKHLFSFMGAKAYTVSMTVLNENQTIRAGETITIKLAFSKLQEDGQPGLVTPTELDVINAHLVLDFQPENGVLRTTASSKDDRVGVLRTTTPTKDGVIIRFSLRRTGNYTLSCLYWRYHFGQSPLHFDVATGPICMKKTFLEIQNPESIPVVVDQWILIPVVGYDRFSNVYQIEEELVPKFGILVKTTHHSVSDYVDSPELEWKFGLEETKLFLQLKAKKARIYKCLMTFEGVPIEQSAHSSSFVVISLNLSEEHMFRTGVCSYSVPGWYATLEFVGIDAQEPSSIYVSIAPKIVTISSVMLAGIIFNPMLAFYINRRTKITLVGAQSLTNLNKEENVFLKISDGIQDSVTFALSAAAARVLLATFGHVKGEKLKRSSFLDKKTALIAEIGAGIFGFFKSSFVMKLDDRDLLASSIAATPTTTRYWLRRFSIGLVARASPTSVSSSTQEGSFSIGSIINSPGTNSMSTDDWLTSVVEILFGNTEGGCLFVKNPGSKRLHPNLASRRRSRWTLKEMEFAGSIVGKYISDSINYGICANLTYICFTKSFLASLIGVPVSYHQFESDYPSFYNKHVKRVLDNTSGTLQLKFETPKGFETEGKNNSAENIALIPNGNNIEVTQQNKIHYLNLLAMHILKNRYELEIASFRLGFYKLIPQGLVADFDIDQLEALICGGGGAYSFDIEDLKANHRLVGGLLDHAGLSDTDLPRYNFSQEEQGKILRWFWIVLTNLSSEERTTLLKFTTGSTALPTCGFKDLSPKFTISLTGGYNQRPKYHPVNHIIAIGNHTSFERFEKNIIESLYERDEIEILENQNENGNERQNLLGGSPTKSDTEFRLETETLYGNAATRYCTIS